MSPRTRLVAVLCVAEVVLSAPTAFAQSPQLQGWAVAGEFAGALGGTWLESTGAPRVTTTTGAQLSLSVNRPTSTRVALGAAIRVSAQSLQLKEAGTSWSGGTLTTGQVLGTMSIYLPHSERISPALEVGGGLSMLSGAKTLLPFSTASRIAPAGEIGLSVRRTANTDVDVRRTAFDLRALALVVRYDVTRLDPGSSASGGEVPRGATAGWVGRFFVGARVMR